jgi:hypothetical protein
LCYQCSGVIQLDLNSSGFYSKAGISIAKVLEVALLSAQNFMGFGFLWCKVLGWILKSQNSHDKRERMIEKGDLVEKKNKKTLLDSKHGARKMEDLNHS